MLVGSSAKNMLQSFFSPYYQGVSPDELKDELPERQPRYPFLSGLGQFLLVIRILFMNPFVQLSADIFYMACKEDGRTVGEKGSGEGRRRTAVSRGLNKRLEPAGVLCCLRR